MKRMVVSIGVATMLAGIPIGFASGGEDNGTPESGAVAKTVLRDLPSDGDIGSIIRAQTGKPALVIDGKPTFANYMWSHTPGPDKFIDDAGARQYAKAGIHRYAFDVGDELWCGPREGQQLTGRVPEDHFDFSTLEQRLQRVIDADPEAKFHLRLHLEKCGEKNWWLKMYPDEVELTEGCGYPMEAFPSGMQPAQSYASELWREHSIAFLRALVQHIEKIGMTDRVIAYQTGHGYTSETFKWSAVGQEIGDHSKPMQKYFRSWLRKHYGNSESALRSAWGNPKVTFETANVPSADQQKTTHHLTFRDPAKEQNVIDYYRAFAELDADLVIEFCRVVKEENGNRALTGIFFGYLFELTGNDSYWAGGLESRLAGLQRSGHLGLRKVLNAPEIDFLVSPYIYFLRSVGGETAPMPPVESVRIHGKMYILEDDTRTHLGDDPRYGRVYSLEDSVTILRRNFAQTLTHGQGIWWAPGEHMDPAKEPAFASLLRQFNELGNWSLQLDSTPDQEIAVLLDDESMFYETIYNDLSLPAITLQRIWGLPRIGAPFGCYLLQDFIEGRVPPAKLYIFMNAWRLDQDRREALAKQLRRNGQTALWIYAPGYIKDDASLDHMTDLTGFKFAKSEFPWGPLMRITDFQHPITEKLSQDLFWGTNVPLGPLFRLDDKDARVLGEVVYSQGTCAPGLGVKEFDDWKSVYVAAPNIPGPVLRGIAKYAGVHLYSEDGDVLYATSDLLAVHTLKGGKRTLRLPKRVELVYDLFERREVARNVDEIQVVLPPRSTSLYFTGDAKVVKDLNK